MKKIILYSSDSAIRGIFMRLVVFTGLLVVILGTMPQSCIYQYAESDKKKNEEKQVLTGSLEEIHH